MPKNEIIAAVGNGIYDYTFNPYDVIAYGATFDDNPTGFIHFPINPSKILVAERGSGGGPANNAIAHVRRTLQEGQAHFYSSFSSILAAKQREEMKKQGFTDDDIHAVEVLSPFRLSCVFPNGLTRAIITIEIDMNQFFEHLREEKLQADKHTYSIFTVQVSDADLKKTKITISDGKVDVPINEKQTLRATLVEHKYESLEEDTEIGTRVCVKLGNLIVFNLGFTDMLKLVRPKEQSGEIFENLPENVKVLIVDGKNEAMAAKLIEAYPAAKILYDCGRTQQSNSGCEIPDLATDRLCQIPHLNKNIVACQEYAEAVAGKKFVFKDGKKIDFFVAKDIFEAMEEHYPDSETIIITLGSRGSLLRVDNQLIRVPSLHVKAVDSNGAGDAYHGAFALGLLKGFRLEEIVLIANIVGALSVCYKGGRPQNELFNRAIRLLNHELETAEDQILYDEILNMLTGIEKFDLIKGKILVLS